MSTPSDPALRVRDVYKFRRESGHEIAILKEISFDLETGRFLSIMGPSGSGKTTLLHLLGGLEETSAGSIELGGQDLATLGERGRALLRRREVGMVFQFFNLVANLNVRENVALPLRIQGAATSRIRARVDELLGEFGLERQAKLMPADVSGGEMQRVALARAIASEPKVLLCDEPTGNLATGQGQEVMQRLRRLREENGQTIVLVTHNPRDAAFGDEVRFLVDGELLDDPILRDAEINDESVHARLRELHI